MATKQPLAIETATASCTQGRTPCEISLVQNSESVISYYYAALANAALELNSKKIKCIEDGGQRPKLHPHSLEPVVQSGWKLLPTDFLFVRMSSVKTYRYRYRCAIISN